MTPKERVQKAISHQQPDMVPYHLEFTVPAREKMVRHFGTDEFENRLGNHLAMVEALPPDAKRETKPGLVLDEWGITWNRTIDKDIGVPDYPMVEPSLERWRFPDPRDPRRFVHFPAFVAENADKFKLLKISHPLFERAWFLRGMENLLVDMIERPHFVDELLDRIIEFALDIVESAAKYELDGVFFGDDWGQQAGLIMGPNLWRRFIKPRMRLINDKVHQKGLAVFLHCCGDVEDLLPEFIEIGIDVFNPFQPEVMDIYKVKKKYGNDLSFFGGISIQRTMPFGAPAEVRKAAKEAMDRLGDKGGYILAPAHAIPGDVPLENILALLEVVQNQ